MWFYYQSLQLVCTQECRIKAMTIAQEWGCRINMKNIDPLTGLTWEEIDALPVGTEPSNVEKYIAASGQQGRSLAELDFTNSGLGEKEINDFFKSFDD